MERVADGSITSISRSNAFLLKERAGVFSELDDFHRFTFKEGEMFVKMVVSVSLNV